MYLQMAANGYAEEAGAACAPSLLGLGGRGQNDVPSPSFIAFNRYERVHGFAAGTLACLACIAVSRWTRPAVRTARARRDVRGRLVALATADRAPVARTRCGRVDTAPPTARIPPKWS